MKSLALPLVAATMLSLLPGHSESATKVLKPKSLAVHIPKFLRPQLRKSPFDAGYDWLQFDTESPDGSDPTKPSVSVDNAADLTLKWRVPLTEVADGAPVFVSNLKTSAGGIRSLIIILTTSGRLLALDATNGALIWHTEPPDGGGRWTTSSPAVDPGRAFVYAYELDGAIHKFDITNGQEITGNGWPELVTLKNDVEKGSTPLTIAHARDGHNYLYMATAGYPIPGDAGDYQGHLVTVNLDTGAQNVFNSACSDHTIHFVENGDATTDCSVVQSGIWARAGAVYDPETDRTFVTTGNGVYDANKGGYNWADSILALRPDGSTDGGTPLDSYTPTEFQRITDEDADLSSTTVAILPRAPGSTLPRLAVQCGKDWLIRLINLSDLSGQGGPRQLGGELDKIPVPQEGEIATKPATWLNPVTKTPWIFISNFKGISAFSLTIADGVPRLAQQWVKTVGGSSPIIANGVLYYAGNGHITALEPTTGNVLWNDDTPQAIHWESPIMVNGLLLLEDGNGYMNAYSIDTDK